MVREDGKHISSHFQESPNVKALEEMVTKLEAMFHPNHYHCYAVKHSLIQLYGTQPGFTYAEMSNTALDRKICEYRSTPYDNALSDISKPLGFSSNSSEVLADSWLLYVYLVLNLMVVTLYMTSNVEVFLMGKRLVFFVELLDCLCRSMSLIRLAI